MEKIIIEKQQSDLEIAGETISGNFATGKSDTYLVRSESNSWEVLLVHTIWENGEEEISSKRGNPEILGIIRNRLRLGINSTDLPEFPESKYVTLRTAVLSTDGQSEWANLHNISLGELSEFTGGNSTKYFKKLGALRLDYRIDIFNKTGSGSKQLIVIFPKDNVDVIIHSFVLTRVYPILGIKTEIE